MKQIFLAATTLSQIIAVAILKLLDSFYLIIGIIILCTLVGAVLNFSASVKNPIAKNIVWGVFYGSLTSLILVVTSMCWLYYHFPA